MNAANPELALKFYSLAVLVMVLIYFMFDRWCESKKEIATAFADGIARGITVVAAQPGDTLVCTVPKCLPSGQIADFRNKMESVLPNGVKCVAVEEGFSMDLIQCARDAGC